MDSFDWGQENENTEVRVFLHSLEGTQSLGIDSLWAKHSWSVVWGGAAREQLLLGGKSQRVWMYGKKQ